jgi:hypothetical protein
MTLPGRISRLMMLSEAVRANRFPLLPTSHSSGVVPFGSKSRFNVP